jgi:hypothetical protein
MCIKQLLIIVRSYSKLQWQQKRLESGWIVSLFDNIQYKVRNVNMVSSFLCLLWHVGLRERKTDHRSCLVQWKVICMSTTISVSGRDVI